VAATKKLVRTAVAGVDASWELHQELQPQIFGSDDAKEGAAAFIEKRAPEWSGS
jgi:enoyl-CoA hydratase